MTDVIVSAHGGRWHYQEKNLTVPKGCEVVFYVPDGEEIRNNRGYDLLYALQEGREPACAERLVGGDPTYDYSCWYADEFSKACGIFAFGGGRGKKALQGFQGTYDEHTPLTLSTIFSTYGPCRVFWDACREVS